MHTRHFVVVALGAIASVFGVTGAEVDQTAAIITALLAALGITDYVKARVSKNPDA